MRPIRFTCCDTLALAPADIACRILDLGNWIGFAGYGVLPGIQAAEYEVRTPDVVGTLVRVTNTDGSSHVEEITEWDPDKAVRLRMTGFTPPLSRLATAFEEEWEFEKLDKGTRVARSFQLYPKTAVARPALWLISVLLRRAIARHLRQMRDLGRPMTDRHPA